MNCQRFQEMLFEYVEGSVSRQERTQADEHLARCSACAVAVQRQKQVQERLSTGFQQSVEALRLGSQGRAELLRTLTNRKSHERSRAHIFAELWVRVAAAVGAAAVLAAVVVWFWRAETSPSLAENQIVERVATQRPEQRPTIQIRLPGIATSYTFQQNGEFVVDTFVEQTNFVNVTLWNSDNEPAEPKAKERKLPL